MRQINGLTVLGVLASVAGVIAIAAHSQPVAPAATPRLVAPVNLDFESDTRGSVPEGWSISSRSREAGYEAAITEDRPFVGHRAAVLRSTDASDGKNYGVLEQVLDARPWRGKLVRFRSAVRAESTPPAWSGLWFRVDREGGRNGFFDNRDRPVRSADWAMDEIVAAVDADAETIHLGVLLSGLGAVYVDAAAVEVTGDLPVPEPPRALEGRGVDNLVAFVRLLGYVRYFHPSDEAAATEWDAFAIDGVRRVESAKDARELARLLESIFAPVAPTLAVFSRGTSAPPLHPALARPAGDAPARTAWLHIGLGTNDEAASGVYKSLRVVDPPPIAPLSAVDVYQSLDATPLRGKRVRVVAEGRTVRSASPGRASVGLGALSEDSKRDYAQVQLPADNWGPVIAELSVPAHAVQLSVGFHVEGAVASYVRTVRAEVVAENGIASPLALANTTFADGEIGQLPPGWSDTATRGQQTMVRALAGDPEEPGRRGLAISGRPMIVPPDPAGAMILDLGGGVLARVPLALWLEEGATLPRGGPFVWASRPPTTALDRATRLAAVALAWNVPQHFYPYFDVVPAAWETELVAALRAAAVDASEREFLDTLRRMTAALQDGHVWIKGPGDDVGSLPLAWDWVEGGLVVTWVRAGTEGVRIGDVVVGFDDVSASAALARCERTISSATPGWARYRALMDLATGPPGSEVTLRLAGADGVERTVRLPCETDLNVDWHTGRIARPAPIAELEPGIQYVDLERVTQEEFDSAVSRLAAARGVIFDKRGYPSTEPQLLGHLTDVELRSAQWQTPIFTKPDRHDVEFEESHWTVTPQTPRFGGKIVFLTDGSAISYAETVMGIVEAYRLGEIVGEPTAGTNGNINSVRLPGNYGMSWTGMRVLKHDGSRHHGVGIQPTVPARRTLAGVRAGHDDVLERALALVR